MAKVRNNIFVRGLSGSVGDQFVIKKDRMGRTIISNAPTFDENREFSEAQLQQQEKFRDAVTYAKDAKTQEVYAEKSESTQKSPFNVAMADWFHAPEIKEIDISAWHGEVGQVIRVKAVDDVKVMVVNVVITNAAGEVYEQGQASQTESGWWHYTSTATAEDGARIVVTARDLPGNIAEMHLD